MISLPSAEVMLILTSRAPVVYLCGRYRLRAAERGHLPAAVSWREPISYSATSVTSSTCSAVFRVDPESPYYDKMAKEQVLGFEPARRLEEVDDEHCERKQEREHRPRSCDDST
jgi:hypothetical protein